MSEYDFISVLKEIYSTENLTKFEDERQRIHAEKTYIPTELVSRPDDYTGHRFKPVNPHTDIKRCIHCGLFKQTMGAFYRRKISYATRLDIFLFASLVVFESHKVDYITCNEKLIKDIIE